MAIENDTWTADFSATQSSKGVGKTEKAGQVKSAGRSGPERSLVSSVGAGSRIKGTVEFDGEAQIDGAVEGEIRSRGELTINETAVVAANITGERVKIFGRVTGDIDCSERLEIHGGAQVTGNISSPAMLIQDGVTFEGRCTMKPSGNQKQS